jgi:hypothetical protein
VARGRPPIPATASKARVAAREWVEIAQVASSIIAACGLLLTACGLGMTAWQMRRTRLTADLQALQKFSEDANKQEATLADAKSDDARLHVFNEFLNFLEIYACAYNNGLVIGRGSKEIIRHKLEDSYIELDAAKEGRAHIAKALDRSTTFAELTTLIRRHRKEVDRRKAERLRAQQ